MNNNLNKILSKCILLLKNNKTTVRSKHSFNWLNKTVKEMSENKLVKELQKIRREQRSKSEKCSPAKVTLQIIGGGGCGSPSSLFISTDHTKYFFNCGEGTQRLANEQRFKLTRLDHIFFTSATWKNMGGLPGLALTIQEAGVPNLTLHGPKGIRDLFEAIRRFVLLNNLTITEAKCSDDTIFEDNCMTVKYVHLKSDNDNYQTKRVDGDYESDDTDYYSYEKNGNGKRNFSIQNSESKKIREESITGCIVYICKLKSKIGALNAIKCLEAGVSPGPKMGLLKRGQDVTLNDGRVVVSADVCDPPIPGASFIVIECPNESYLDNLLENEHFKKYQENGEDLVNHIIHFSPGDIIENPKYKSWMKKFSPATQHVIANEHSNCYNVEGANRIQHKLHLLDPKIFPILKEIDEKDEKTYEDSNIYQAKTMTAIHLRPHDGLDKSSEIKIDPEVEVQEAFAMDGFLDALAELQTDLSNKYNNSVVNTEYPKVVMLGTGSSIPNKTRNTSGILLLVDEETSILMDCGEGTLGQIVRFFGMEKSKEILKSIKAIYISHLHADHHIGLLGILQERHKFNKEPVYLLAPMQIGPWLVMYHNLFEPCQHFYSLVSNQSLLLAYNKLVKEDKVKEMMDKAKLKSVNTVNVVHCLHAFGVSFTLLDGRTIVYSGDTRPSINLVSLGQNCDLLIHEATMEIGMEADAAKKMHSTIGQAIEIGQKMNAKFTLLTHFSQRYSKLVLLPEDTGNNVGVAYDNMCVSLSQLQLLPQFYPVLKLMFSEFYDTLQIKAQKNSKRR